MADSDFEFEDDLPDWSDDDDKPKCASAAKERRTEPPLLLTLSLIHISEPTRPY